MVLLDKVMEVLFIIKVLLPTSVTNTCLCETLIGKYKALMTHMSLTAYYPFSEQCARV